MDYYLCYVLQIHPFAPPVSSPQREFTKLECVAVDDILNDHCATWLKKFDSVDFSQVASPPSAWNVLLQSLKYMQDTCQCQGFCLPLKTYLLQTPIFTKSPFCGEWLQFRRPRYAICTLFVGEDYRKKIRHCIRSKYEYARHYGYRLITDDQFQLNDKHPAWMKCSQILKYLPDYDYLFWIDGDAMIANLSVSLDCFFLLLKSPFLNMISRDLFEINSGVMLLKNCPETVLVLSGLPHTREEWQNTTCFEQRPLIEIVRSNIIPHLFLEIQQQVWNAYERRAYGDQAAFFEGDFILHFAGYNILNRELFQLQHADAVYGSVYIDFFPFPFNRFPLPFSPEHSKP